MLHGTCWLESDVLLGSSSAPCSCHDLTGLDINLNFPDAHLGSGTGLQSCNMAMDSSPTEKQAPAGAGCCISNSLQSSPASTSQATWTPKTIGYIHWIVTNCITRLPSHASTQRALQNEIMILEVLEEQDQAVFRQQFSTPSVQ